MTTQRQYYEELLKKPEVKALLNTIRYAEGTSGPAGYQTMFGGGKFSDLSRHPDKVISSGGYSSAAAGAYQFLPGTWSGASKALGLKTFTPAEQDVAALYLIQRRGALDPFLKGEKFGNVLSKLAPEWASLPTASGSSYYGQPVKKLEDLWGVYQKEKSKAGVSTAEAQPAIKTSQTPGGIVYNVFIDNEGTPSRRMSPTDFLKSMLPQESRDLRYNPAEVASALTSAVLNAPTYDYGLKTWQG